MVMPRSRSMSIRSRYCARIVAVVDDTGELQHPVGQRRLAVVDVGDDAEVPDLRRRGEGLVGETADGNLLVGRVACRAPPGYRGRRPATQSCGAPRRLCSTAWRRSGRRSSGLQAREPGVQRGAEVHPPAAAIRDAARAASSRASRSASDGHHRRPPTEPPAITAGRPVTNNSVPTAHRARRVVYAPDLDGRADPGEIVWTWVVYEDDPTRGQGPPGAGGGPRPAHAAGPDAVQPGPPPRRPATGSASAAAAGTTRAGPAGCGWTGCSTCPRRASGARARSWSARRSRWSPRGCAPSTPGASRLRAKSDRRSGWRARLEPSAVPATSATGWARREPRPPR